eukprot:2509284-Rhodomonas_salina.1
MLSKSSFNHAILQAVDPSTHRSLSINLNTQQKTRYQQREKEERNQNARVLNLKPRKQRPQTAKATDLVDLEAVSDPRGDGAKLSVEAERRGRMALHPG